MPEYVIIAVIVSIAAWFVVARFVVRKNPGCGCGNGSACACSVDGDASPSRRKDDHAMQCDCSRTR